MQVTVDDDFARFGGKSYAINKINSVEVRERQPHGLAVPIVLGAIAALCLLAGLASLGDGGASYLVIGAIFAAIAFFAWKKSAIREYSLFLMTSSSETQAFITRDHGEVTGLREKIERAMLRHSRAGTDR